MSQNSTNSSDSLHLLDRLFHGFRSDVTFSACSEWQGPHHIFMQVANFLALLGLMFASSGLRPLAFMRTMLIISNLTVILWTWLVVCSSDLLLWNTLFVAVNTVHLVVLLIKLRPFITFPHEIEMAYRNVFQPLGVDRRQFQKLQGLTRTIQTLKPKDIYSIEGQTSLDRLSLLLSGRVSVLRNGTPRHIIDSYQFLESPEWFGMTNGDKYQVTICALEECQILIWNRDKLKLCISTDRYLQTILDHILARDIVKKLMLSLEIESASITSEKTRLIQQNFPMEQLMSLNSLQGATNCFWNLTPLTTTFDTDSNNQSHMLHRSPSHETTL